MHLKKNRIKYPRRLLWAAIILACGMPLSWGESIKNEYLVKFKIRALLKSQYSEVLQINPTWLKKIEKLGYQVWDRFGPNKQFALLKAQDQSAVPLLNRSMMKEIAADVEYIEPNYKVKAFALESSPAPAEPNPLDDEQIKQNLIKVRDPHFIRNWGLYNFGQRLPNGITGKAGTDIGTLSAWEIFKGSPEMVVAIIDTGIDYRHADLKDNMWNNVNEIAGNGIDDDHNGYVDDRRGFSFAPPKAGLSSNLAPIRLMNVGSPLPYKDPWDDNGHGTHCAGTIGARGGNLIGTVGVNWQVKLMPVKFLSAEGSGSTYGAYKAIEYAINNGAKVLSNSWGGGDASRALLDLILEANERGIIFVAAAGNDNVNNDHTPSFPASYPAPNVVSVAATDNTDNLAYFSNYGSESVGIAAPGYNIFSTVPENSYAIYSGTSMATPHVSGAVALLWGLHPDWSHQQIIEQLYRSSVYAEGLYGKVKYGRLQVGNMLKQIDVPKPWINNNWIEESINLSTPHGYERKGGIDWRYQVYKKGAKLIKVYFEKSWVDDSWDFVYVLAGNNRTVDAFTGYKRGYWSAPVQGDRLIVRLQAPLSRCFAIGCMDSNPEINYGFDVTRIAYVK